MTRKRLVALVILGVILTISLIADSPHTASNSTQPPPPPGLYRITNFIDGDTIEVAMNSSKETIRFIGIDTPEVSHHNTTEQCYGPEASAHTKELINTQPVRLEADPVGDNRDRYSRLLRYVYLPDGTLLNQRLIADGYAFAYLTFPFSKKEEFAATQGQAQEAGRGLWTACQPQLNKGRWHSNEP